MANNNSALQFVGICNNSFFFEEVSETCLDKDGFEISEDCSQHLIRSSNNQFVLLSLDDKEFQLQDLATTERSQTDFQFIIQPYKDSESVEGPGKPVVLYVPKDGKKMVVCCSEEDVYPEAMDLPDKIEEISHKALFLLIKQSTSNKYVFQSYLIKTKFLGLDTDEDDSSVSKLVLLHKTLDEPDQRSQFSLMCYFFGK